MGSVTDRKAVYLAGACVDQSASQSTLTNVAATEPCATVYIEPGQAVCGMSNSQSAIDLEDVLNRINNDPAINKIVHDATTIWIEAWDAPLCLISDRSNQFS
jgi:hypothetical protein